MSRHKNNSTYKTEYSESFKWQRKECPEFKKSLNNNSLSEKSNHSIRDNHVHNYRRKLKHILLKRLENLEAECKLQRKSHINGSSSSVSLISDIQPTKTWQKQRVTKLQINGLKRDDSQNELRRSRSMALEFKERNEGTQIWWWNEDVSSESSDTSKTKANMSFPPRMVGAHRLVVRHDDQALSRSHSFVSTKLSSTDPSQSTFTRSSISALMAQATGYQSTTDDFSSFYHDNDSKSNDPNDNSAACAPPQHTFGSKISALPRLRLDVNYDESSSNESLNHVIFSPPYQKEDFIKDTTSSESNGAIAPQFDTYRLE